MSQLRQPDWSSNVGVVFKDGELVARNGKVVKETHGMTHAVRPEYDKSIERTLKRHFSEHQTVSFENCSVADWEIEERLGRAGLAFTLAAQAHPDAHPRPVECPTTSAPCLGLLISASLPLTFITAIMKSAS